MAKKSAIDLAKRQRVMSRSAALGRCICSPQKPCPCPEFKEDDICECAGEKPKRTELDDSTALDLTKLVRNPGCASKIAKADLKRILAGLPELSDERVLVGSSDGDDAGVMVLRELPDKAMILTVDVFSPSVADPYEFGQIAAANSLSDIYAMGAEPWSALSIIGFPVKELPEKAMCEILRGGLDKMKEAGVPVVGGHSINDSEVKCGFAVTGICGKDAFIRNSGAQPGDAIVLSKALGAQLGLASTAALRQSAESMKTLNKEASKLMRQHGAHAATDVTGYSLLGHMAEIAINSGVNIEINFDSVPIFDEVQELVRRGIVPGAAERNREAVPQSLLSFSGLCEAQENILFSPETSGGLLVFLPAANSHSFLDALKKQGLKAAIIGKVAEKRKPGGRIVVSSKKSADFSPLKPQKITMPAVPEQKTETLACCAQTPGTEEGKLPLLRAEPAAKDAFQAYMGAVMAPGSIDLKNKKLMALALSVATRCGPCIKINIKAAREAGAKETEIGEAVSMGAAFGGAPAMMYYNNFSREE